ncbi:MAG TPA: ATP-binding protein [Usitatibacter sp.]|nr:ATP-binding protein [Usitatibacter sp.]
MTEIVRPSLERRLLILAPTGRDAPLTGTVLAEGGVRSAICDDMAALVREIGRGAGAVLVSEEAVVDEAILHHLGERLARQAPWSDLPVLLLSRPGADSPIVRQAVRLLGNVTLLERPVRVPALMTAVQTALRARQRQYNAREHLADLDHIAKALRESEGRLQAIFANAAVGIAELTADGRFALVNDSLCRLLGEKRESLLSLPLAALAHGDDREDVARLMPRLAAGEMETFVGERRFVRHDGETVWLKLALAPAKAAEDGGMRGAVVVEDVTERKHAEDDLREADRRKDEFLATLAHELRNPLAPIRNSLHIFRMAGVQDPGVKRVVDMMERQVAHMVRMVDDLLEISRISRGKIELRKERVELAGVLRSAVDTSLPLIEAARHRLSVEVPEGSLVLDADPVRLAQVFANLLNNSAKYTREGGEISVKAGVEPGMAVVRVKDNGEGIPPAMLERVFNMFTQLNTGARAHGGLGIGLTLAKTLVHLHGGTIEAASEGGGKGSEFVVRLPLAAGAPRVEAIAPPAEAMAGVGRMHRVLVVDDNHDAADSLGMLLRLLGAEVMVVHDGRSALAAMKTFRPTVVLLDLGMPEMNGLEVARRMREDPESRRTTLVALTGWGQREDRRRTHEAGFDYHLVKPADVGTLQSILSLQETDESRLVRH